jgi:aminoglycoside/choline kinase family phosphotransferase
VNRDSILTAFLARNGYAAARTEPLAQDASFRRYLRLSGGPRRAVLMDAPPPEDIRPFVRIAGHLAGIGVSVPEIYAVDETQGLLLEEDFGNEQVSDYSAAVDTLIAMQRAAPPAGLPAWNGATMAATALATLFDWWWPAMFSVGAPNAALQDFAGALEEMLASVAGPVCFVHRDYFAGNLFWLPQRGGIRRIGALDFQDAAIGHPAYDLAALLQDARRDIPPAVAEHYMARYLAARPELDPTQFRAAYAACAVQRHLRLVGQWVRLALRDGRPGYLVHGPRTWRLLERTVREPVAAPLAIALDRWIPPDRRRNPPALAA